MKRLAFVSALALMVGSAGADEFRPALEAYLEDELRGWINDPVLVAAVQAQNARTSGYDQATIDSLDQAWRAEVGSGSSQVISDVLENATANFLRERVEASGGVITEVFAMDALGLNVAASSATSDYWQGDEDKHRMTYGAGAGSVHISQIEFDESSQTYQGQISVVIVDPNTNTPIGAITVGVDAESLL